MHIGDYVDGRPLNYDETSHVFDIGGTTVTLKDVVAYDQAGQVGWFSDELHAWAQALASGDSTTRQVSENRPEPVLQRKTGRLFGFRSRRVWKMIVASAYYGLCAIMLVGVFASVRPYSTEPRDVVLDVVSYLVLVLAMFVPALLLSDFRYRQKLPLFRRHKLLSSAVGLAIVVLSLAGVSAFAYSLHSEPYKTAERLQRLAQEKKNEAAQQAERAAEARAAAQREAEENAARAAEASRTAEAARLAKAKRVEKQSAGAAAVKAKLQRQRAAVIQFEKDVYSLEVPAQRAIKKYQAAMTRFSKGQASIYDAYDAASDAKSACESVRSAYWDLEAPTDLPDDVSTLLGEVTSSLSTGYSVKAEAFGAAMEFLDDQKPSSMQEFKDKVAQADSFTIDAVAKLLEAKEKLGIPLAKPAK